MTFSAISEAALCEAPEEGIASAFVRAVSSVTAARAYLVELYPYQAVTGTAADWVPAISEDPIAALPAGQEGQTGITQLNYSDVGFTTTPSDPIANEHYEGRAEVPLIMEQILPLSPEKEQRGTVQFGAIELLNNDGYLDNIFKNYAIDGRRVRILAGLKTSPYSDFGTLFDGVATGWAGDLERLRINVRDNSYRLDLPLQQTLYGGTGGSDGTADIQGKPKPLCFGKCLNITPVLIAPASWIFQVNARAISAISAVYSDGAAVTASGVDYASYAALAAASITAGQFATCLAEGLFRINFSSTAGVITADVLGDAVGGYVNTAANIAQRIITDFGGLSTSYLDTGSFNQLNTSQGAVIGWYSGAQSITASDALNQVLGGISAYWLCDSIGRITVGRIEEPDASNPLLILDSTDVLDVSVLSMPDNLFPPNWRRRVGYQRNWTVQSGEALAGVVTADRRNFLKEEQRIAYAVNASVQTRYLQATDPDPVRGLFDASTDAQNEANRLLSLYQVDRQYISVRLKTIGFLGDLRRSILLTWPRYSITNKAFLIVGRRFDCDKNEVTLTLWG